MTSETDVRPCLRALAGVALCVLLAACQPATDGGSGVVSVPPPPDTRREPVEDVLHGRTVEDPYRWLESIDDPDVSSWLDAHDERARGVLASLPRRDALRDRLAELTMVDEVSAPTRRGGRLFYSRRHRDKEKAVHYWRDGLEGEERILFDPNRMGDGGPVSIGVVVPDPSGRRVAYSIRANNADEATLYIRDLDIGEDSARDVIPGAKYAYPAWMPDGSGFFYTWVPVDPSIPIDRRPGEARIRFHRLGTDPESDPLLYGPTGDPTRFVGVELSDGGRWLIVYEQYGWSATDVRIRDLARDDAPLVPLAVGLGARFDVEEHDGTLYALTNLDAPHWRIVAIDPQRPARENWRVVVPERDDASIDDEDGLSIVGGHLVVKYLSNASSELRIVRPDGTASTTVELPGTGSVGSVLGRPGDSEAFATFSSFTTPRRVIRISVPGGRVSTWAEADVPVDPARFETSQVRFPSKDGTTVSMFLVHRKGLEPTGDVPTLLFGYGGFNVALTPTFKSFVIPWIENGGLYAEANLRGGSEYGEEWHRGGMLENKQNVFDDFIAAAEWLTESRWTNPDRLAIYGRSNGGLLVGAAMTQRPDLCRAVICGVPLLDMIRYHRFGSGRTWIGEYGSAEDPRQFETLLAYSPYHRVRERTAYPALLMLSTDADDRVDPMHARKFVAAISHATSSGLPVLLRVEKNAGHGGSDMASRYADKWADVHAFLFWQLGAGGGEPGR